MPNQYQLFAISDLSRVALRTATEQNLVEFFKWAFVDAGGYTEVPVLTPGTPDAYGDETLTAVHQDTVTDGTIWQAVHRDWVYETGLQSGRSPTVASGVYVAGNFYPTATTSGAYAHSLDFVHGRVNFTTPVPTGTVVQVAYAHRTVSIYDASVPWYRPVVLNDFTEQRFAAAAASGVVPLLDDLDLEPPLVVVECPEGPPPRAKEIGSVAHWIDQDVLFYVVAPDRYTRDAIVDAIRLQTSRAITMFDSTARRAANDSQLDWKGSPTPSGSQYPALTQTYPWKTLYLTSSRVSQVDPAIPLFRGVVRLNTTTDHGYA